MASCADAWVLGGQQKIVGRQQSGWGSWEELILTKAWGQINCKHQRMNETKPNFYRLSLFSTIYWYIFPQTDAEVGGQPGSACSRLKSSPFQTAKISTGVSRSLSRIQGHGGFCFTRIPALKQQPDRGQNPFLERKNMAQCQWFSVTPGKDPDLAWGPLGERFGLYWLVFWQC